MSARKGAFIARGKLPYPPRATPLLYFYFRFYSGGDESASKKMDPYIPSEKIRILQDNLVFVSALPSDLSAKEVRFYLRKVLQRDIYFGRYGKVSKLIINPPYPHKKGVLYQAYATYTS